MDNLTMLNETLAEIERGVYQKDWVFHNLKLTDIDIRQSKYRKWRD